MSILIKILTVIKYVVLSTLGLVAIISLMVLGPQIHETYLRTSVGSKVVMLLGRTSDGMPSGGTGFFIKAPSGNSYILTNKHVCNLASPNGNIFIKLNDDDVLYPRRVIHKSSTHDLCLVSGFADINGLELASFLLTGQNVAIIGHPALFPLTVSRAQFIGYTEIMLSPLKSEIIRMVDGLPKILKDSFILMGFDTFEAAQFVGYSRGGNSGSPIVNFMGNVVAVLFAGNPQDNQETYAVPLSYIEKFIEKY